MISSRAAIRYFSITSRLSCNNKVKDLLENAVTGSEIQNEQDSWSTSPYTEGTIFNRYRDQSKKSKRSGRDPSETTIVLFPGQGAQYVGMAKSLVRIPEARDMFELASSVLG